MTLVSQRPVTPTTSRLLSCLTRDPAEHAYLLGPRPQPTAADLISLLTEAGLTGRGGGGFPTGRKLAALADQPRPVVVANAMEGEPWSSKDALLVSRAPYLVADGVQIVARALGAQRAIVAVGPDGDPQSLRATGRSDLEVLTLAGGFVSGQESALVNGINGLPAVPRDPSTPVRHRGVDGRPTLISNVETFAHIALIARYGAAWFRSVGTAVEPGTFLATIGGAVARPGVVELSSGVTLRQALAGAEPRSARGVLLGGFHGTWLPVAALDVPLHSETMTAYGARVGAGVVHLLDARTCPLDAVARIAGYLATESAGQCGPCVNGLPRMADTVRRLASRDSDASLPGEVARLAALAAGRGACAHPDGTARMVLSALRAFGDHVDQHLDGDCDATAS